MKNFSWVCVFVALFAFLGAVLAIDTEKPPLPNDTLDLHNPFDRTIAPSDMARLKLAAQMRKLHHQINSIASHLPKLNRRPVYRRGVEAIDINLAPTRV